MSWLKKHRGFFILIALAAVLFTSDIAGWKEFVRAESYFALGARLMIEQGDWLTPHAPDEQQLNKPPLTYWLIGLAYKIFGIGYGASRVPSALAALGVLAIIYAFGSRVWDKQVGLMAAAVLLTSMLFMSFARTAMSDMLLTLFVTAAVSSFAMALNSDRRFFALAGYLAMALGMLTKGPVAIVVIVVPIAIELVLRRDGSALRTMRIASGLILLVLICAPYFAAIYFRRGADPLWFFFLGENVQRFTGALYSESARPFWYQLAAFFGDLAPWSLLIFPAIWADWRHRSRPESEQSPRLLYLWLAVTLLLFSLSSFKRDYYLLPAMPAAALIVGRLLSKKIESPFIQIAVAVCLFIAALLIFAVALGAIKADRILGVDSVGRFLPIAVAGCGLLGVAWWLVRAKSWAAALMLAASIAATFMTIELTSRAAFARFLPAADLVKNNPGRLWMTSHQTGAWASDIAFNSPFAHDVERNPTEDDTGRLHEWLQKQNAIALMSETDFDALRKLDPSARILQRVETFGHGGLTQKLLLNPKRDVLLVVGH